MSPAQYPSLEDRIVFITGGATGIGAAMVEAFALNHSRVVFLDILADASEALVERLSNSRHKPAFMRCDVTDIAALRASIENARTGHGPISVLVNNAANDDRHEFDEVTPEYWEQTMAVNLRHQFFAAQAAHTHMKDNGGGSIINFSSIAWMFGGASLAVYASAKAAVVGMTNSLARQFGADNIRVNAIAPGAVVTERQLRLWYNEEQADETAQRQAMKRRLLPEDIARVALFLASDDSAMVTKQCIVVDGGLR